MRCVEDSAETEAALAEALCGVVRAGRWDLADGILAELVARRLERRKEGGAK